MRQPRKEELAEWGENALRQLRGPVLSSLREKLAQWRDPRARLVRQRRRAKFATTTGAVATGTFGAGSVASFSPQFLDYQVDEFVAMVMTASGFGLSALTAMTGAGTVGMAMRYRRLKRTPMPEPAPAPVELPPPDSEAREPMRRLRDAEQSLHEALAQLNRAGVGGGSSAVADARATADDAAAALRQVAARLRAVEAAMPHAPEADQEALRSDVLRLRQELDDGVDSYGGLVAAASRTVAASGAPEQKHLLQDATDRLAGLASALRELSSADRDVQGP